MKVKIFAFNNAIEIENTINDFLSNNPEIKIKDIKQTQTNGDGMNVTRGLPQKKLLITISIWYEI